MSLFLWIPFVIGIPYMAASNRQPSQDLGGFNGALPPGPHCPIPSLWVIL